MKVVIVTVVHHPLDARITTRQARALVDAGHEVVMVAPWSQSGATPPVWIQAIDVPRTSGRRRVAPLLAARRTLAPLVEDADIVLAHDPDLVPMLVALGLRGDTRPVAVFDVHEDTAAALGMRAWVPAGTKSSLTRGVQAIERLAERRFKLILAEEGYRDRFLGTHPVVPNTAWVPDTPVPFAHDRVIYVGALTAARGAADMVALGQRLRPHGIAMTIIGPAHGGTDALLREAHQLGNVDWRGPLPNDESMALVDGSLAGISLLHDQPNYRVSMPTKIMEYMARGVPVVTTPLPAARSLVEIARAGSVVDWGSPGHIADEATKAILQWRDDIDLRNRIGANGHRYVLEHHSWQRDAQDFVRLLEQWSAEASSAPA
jgi:glycosyltransferase involved in cell wall biosynthesis